MNFKTIKTTCTECKSNTILYDTVHNETFCNKCGLILQDNRLTLITDAIQEEQLKEQRLREALWHRRHVKGE